MRTESSTILAEHTGMPAESPVTDTERPGLLAELSGKVAESVVTQTATLTTGIRPRQENFFKSTREYPPLSGVLYIEG
jgi:hypothetical protein